MDTSGSTIETVERLSPYQILGFPVQDILSGNLRINSNFYPLGYKDFPLLTDFKVKYFEINETFPLFDFTITEALYVEASSPLLPNNDPYFTAAASPNRYVGASNSNIFYVDVDYVDEFYTDDDELLQIDYSNCYVYDFIIDLKVLDAFGRIIDKKYNLLDYYNTSDLNCIS